MVWSDLMVLDSVGWHQMVLDGEERGCGMEEDHIGEGRKRRLLWLLCF